MEELIPFLGVAVTGLLLSVWMQEDLDWTEARWFWGSLLAHFACFSVLLIGSARSQGHSDMANYVHFGQLLANDLRHDFWGVLPHSFSAFFHLPSQLSLALFGQGTTATVAILTGWICYLVGDSLVAANAVFMFASVFGKLALYRGLRVGFPHAMRDRVAISVFMVPSFVFWTSGTVKETLAMVGIGIVVQAFSLAFSRWSVRAVFRVLLGALLVGLVKPYVLFVFTGAAGVLVYYRMMSKDGNVITFKPFQLMLLMFGGVVAILLLGLLFPQFAIDRIAEEAANRQSFAFKSQGRSTYFIGDPTQLSFIGQAAFAPAGIITAWYRPFLFEARTAMSLISALEGTLFLIATVFAVIRVEGDLFWKAMSKWPWIPFSLSFAVVFGAVVGLVSGNFGTMVRYRVPLMPFLALVLLVFSMPNARLKELVSTE